MDYWGSDHQTSSFVQYMLICYISMQWALLLTWALVSSVHKNFLQVLHVNWKSPSWFMRAQYLVRDLLLKKAPVIPWRPLLWLWATLLCHWSFFIMLKAHFKERCSHRSESSLFIHSLSDCLWTDEYLNSLRYLFFPLNLQPYLNRGNWGMLHISRCFL